MAAGLAERWLVKISLAVAVILTFSVNQCFPQSNEQLLGIIRQMRQQIESQQKQLQQLELQLRQRMEAPKQAVAPQPQQTGTPVEPPAERGATLLRGHEWYVGGFVGGAFPQDTDLRSSVLSRTGLLPDVRAKNASLDSSPVVGAKAGGCPRFFLYVCAELEFDYLSPKLDRQSPGSSRLLLQGPFPSLEDFLAAFSPPQDAQIPRFDFDVYNMGLNLIARFPLLKEPNFPLDGRLHLYTGAGPSFVWTRAKNKDCIGNGGIVGVSQTEGGVLLSPLGIFQCDESDTDFTVGVQALTGTKFFITRNLAVFGEYKFKHWSPDFSFPPKFFPVSEIQTDLRPLNIRLTDLDFNVHLFYLGLAYHW